jgi:2,5-dihydroxypyridine 5,6-dioxygenase
MTEHRTLARLREVLRDSALEPGELVGVLSESTSRRVLVDAARLAAEDLGARVCEIVVPTPPNPGPVALRSTGASVALAGQDAAVAALAACGLVVDCTVEGLIHAPELPAILAGGARVLMIGNEDPEALDRLGVDPALRVRVQRDLARLEAAARMRVTSDAGTDLDVDLAGAFRAGSWGATSGPGTFAHYPGGLVAAYPAAGTVSGRVVLRPGDINLTFTEYLRSQVELVLVDDRIVEIAGDGLDAELMRSYLSAFDEEEAYAVSHVGWGLNPAARWDALALLDKRETNGLEARVFPGCFLFSTGANENAGRYTRGHFDLPMRGCTIALDGEVVVDAGRLVDG